MTLCMQAVSLLEHPIPPRLIRSSIFILMPSRSSNLSFYPPCQLRWSNHRSHSESNSNPITPIRTFCPTTQIFFNDEQHLDHTPSMPPWSDFCFDSG